MAVTDLTNTKWLINENPSSHSNATFYITFTSNSEANSIFGFDNEGGFGINYNRSGLVYYTGEWVSGQAYRTIEITGGTDATNSTLIAWLIANATQQIEPSSDVIETTISVGTNLLADAGMTWAEWVASAYNTINAYADEYSVWEYLSSTYNFVSPNDTITPNGTYSWRVNSG